MYETEVIEVAILAALLQRKTDIPAKRAVAKAIELLEEVSAAIKYERAKTRTS